MRTFGQDTSDESPGTSCGNRQLEGLDEEVRELQSKVATFRIRPALMDVVRFILIGLAGGWLAGQFMGEGYPRGPVRRPDP